MTDLNRDTGGTSQRRGVHGDPWRRAGAHDVRNGDHFAAANHPLHELVAGRIDQAEYRRRMAELERRAADSLDVEPEPIRRRPEPDRSGMVIVWMAVLFGLCLLVIAIAGIVATLAAPRSAPDSTTLAPAHDMSGRLEGTSGPELFGAPLGVNRTVEPLEAPSASAGAGDVGGAP